MPTIRPVKFRISDFEFRISDLPPPSLQHSPGTHSRRGAVAEGLVARAARRRGMAVVCDRQIAAYRGPQQRPVAAAAGAAKPPRRPRGNRTGPRPAKLQRSGGFAIATRLNLWVRFSDWSDGGIGRPAISTERREENAARGPESARSHIGKGVRPCSKVARRRAKGAQRARSTAPTRACSRRGRGPRPRGRGRRPRTAGGHAEFRIPNSVLVSSSHEQSRLGR
jgi:hypothetical protein